MNIDTGSVFLGISLGVIVMVLLDIGISGWWRTIRGKLTVGRSYRFSPQHLKILVTREEGKGFGELFLYEATERHSEVL